MLNSAVWIFYLFCGLPVYLVEADQADGSENVVLCYLFIKYEYGMVWFQFHQVLTWFGCFREDWVNLVWCGLAWLDLVWFGLVWVNIHLKLLWKYHQDLTCCGCFREDFELVWYCLVCFETTSIQSYCESFIKIQLFVAVLEKIYI